MKPLRTFLFFFLFLIQGCKGYPQNPLSANKTIIEDCENTSVKQNKNALWACYISNNNMDSLSTLYTSNAIKVRTTGEVFEIADAISSYYSKKEVSITAVNSVYRTEANFVYDYEIGTFTLASGETYKHVVIWNKTTSSKREFEFIAKAEEEPPIDPAIKTRRNEWIDLCNSHDALALVSALYTSNTVYYNHKPVVVGIEAVAKEYRYMNQPSYTLSLFPLHLEMVTPTLAFEIGQCSGSYNGKYIIVWQKEDRGTWKVLLDSNI